MITTRVRCALLATTGLLLAACAGGGPGNHGATSPAATASPTPTATAAPSATPTVTPTIPPALSAQGLPSTRIQAAMGYDPISRRVILFGGAYPVGHWTFYSQTWAWGGTQWTQLHPAATPPVSSGAAMGLDPLTGRLALAGGSPGPAWSAPGRQTGMWEWDGGNWARVPGGDPPLQLYGASLVGDPVHHLLTYTGQTGGGDDVNRGGAWSWDGHTWRSTVDLPTEGWSGACPTYAGGAFDPISNRVVHAAGIAQNPCGSTAVFDGTSWSAATSTTLPLGSAYAATDSARGQVVMLASSTDINNPRLPTTWTWDGRTWVRHIVDEPPVWQTGPPGAVAIADDPAVHRVVAYVVTWTQRDAAPWSSMWAWDGSDWTRIPA